MRYNKIPILPYINKINRNKEQPRKRFDEEKLDELADSIHKVQVAYEDENKKIELPHGMEIKEEVSLPAVLRWGGSEDSDGLALTLHFDDDPVFCEAYFEDDLLDANLMMEINRFLIKSVFKTSMRNTI